MAQQSAPPPGGGASTHLQSTMHEGNQNGQKTVFEHLTIPISPIDVFGCASGNFLQTTQNLMAYGVGSMLTIKRIFWSLCASTKFYDIEAWWEILKGNAQVPSIEGQFSDGSLEQGGDLSMSDYARQANEERSLHNEAMYQHESRRGQDYGNTNMNMTDHAMDEFRRKHAEMHRPNSHMPGSPMSWQDHERWADREREASAPGRGRA